MTNAAIVIIAVAIQPIVKMVFDAVYLPITEAREDKIKIATINGTATTPLITALQNNPFIGLMGKY